VTAPSSAEARQIRGSSLLLLGTLLASLVDFGSQVLLVRYLAKSDFGAWSYALAVVALLTSVAQFEMRNAAARFIPIYLERRETGKVVGIVALAIGVAVGLGLVMATAITVGVLFFHLQLTVDPLSMQLLALVALLIPLQAVDGVFTGLFAAFGASRTIFLRQSVLGPALRFGLVVVLVALAASLTFLAIGYLLATLAGVALYAGTFRRLLREHRGPAPEREPVTFPFREVLLFAGPLLTSTLVWTLMESSDAILLGLFKGPDAVANFRVVLPLARMNGIVAVVFAVLYLPLAARSHERRAVRELKDLYWRTALWMTVLTFPILLMTLSFAPAVTVGLYGAGYAESAPILALLAGGYFFHTALGFNGLTLKVHNRLRYTMAIDIAMAVVNIAVNLVLIPAYGPLGAAIGTAGTLIVHNILKHIGLARFTPIPAFDRRYAAVYAALVATAALLLVAQAVLSLNLLGSFAVAAACGLAVLWGTRRLLDVDTFFPELRRVPLPPRVAAAVWGSELSVPPDVPD
jgi:O-antigen/teichoic acid export membrane protein